ncbi:MAG: malonate transporter subunit MadL [Planctomycetaceae bacterium]|nr:malonate transporter subunit MadL [Planctomycetaceae bacterium]
MVIYGTGLLAFCLLAGAVVGQLLGYLLGVDANVGGVGIAMIALIVLSDRLQKRGALQPPTRQGVLFWSAVYIPVVVAMAASQNVQAAVTGGPAAITAGVASVAACLLLVPAISRLAPPLAESTFDAADANSSTDEGR